LPSVRGEEACKNFLKEFLTKELVWLKKFLKIALNPKFLMTMM
jgi:hypothetical protein